MIYKYNKCPASSTGDPLDCVHCVNWLNHLDDETDCECNTTTTKTPVQENADLINLESVTASTGGLKLSCSKCARTCTRDYPAFHVHESIIDSHNGVPNPPLCERCLS